MTPRPSTITTWTSTNGTTFTSFGAPISVTQYLGQPGGLKVGVFAKHDGSADDTVQFDAFNVVAGTADPQTRGRQLRRRRRLCPQNDEFDGTALDAEVGRRATRRRPTWPSPAASLALTTAQGDVSGANFTARNILLQEVPERPVDGDHEARPHGDRPRTARPRGLVVIYGSSARTTSPRRRSSTRPTPILSGQPMNGKWAERVLTVQRRPSRGTLAAASTRTPGALTPPTSDLWLRRDATTART